MLYKQTGILYIVAATIVSGFLLAGVALAEPAAKTSPTPFLPELQKVSSEYRTYGKVFGVARVAPVLCFAPPPTPSVSKSKDVSTHGKKLYYLFSKNYDQYVKNEAPQPGQVLVKESWVPADFSTSTPTELGRPDGLFIMMKLDPKTSDTDNGWVYATVASDRKTVTSAGRVQSCMECHSSASNDRLFGLTK